MRSLIVGDGYLAATLAEQLRQSGVSVERAPRPDRPELDRLLGAQQPDQVVMAPPGPGGVSSTTSTARVGWRVRGQKVPSTCDASAAMLEHGGTVLAPLGRLRPRR